MESFLEVFTCVNFFQSLRKASALEFQDSEEFETEGDIFQREDNEDMESQIGQRVTDSLSEALKDIVINKFETERYPKIMNEVTNDLSNSSRQKTYLS